MQLEEAFTNAEEFADDIMDRISNLLNENNIDFTFQNDYEIVVSGKTKSDIKDIISSDDTLDPQVLKMMISITEINGNTFIRQKYD